MFEGLNEVTKAHLRPLYIKALVERKLINRVLMDRGTAINLLAESMLEKFGKGNKDLVGPMSL